MQLEREGPLNDTPMTQTLPDERVLDVRNTPPRERHPMIFGTYDGLTAGASFVLVNDHDPKPLYYQFQAEHTGEFSWDYLEKGPQVWRVRIAKLARPSGREPLHVVR